MLFTVKDYQENPVSLAKETWLAKLLDPKTGHPEVRSYFEEVKLTIQKPEFVYQSVRDPRSKILYKSGVGKGKFVDCYLVVVVK